MNHNVVFYNRANNFSDPHVLTMDHDSFVYLTDGFCKGSFFHWDFL